ncbi:MAG: EpsG family protein [Endomicrobiaceae bacterium]|nr:EpsG family protein [Endomicrobiaceae bacterium]
MEQPTYRNNYHELIILFFMSIISPLLALPFILISIYKKNIYSIYILAFIISLFIGLMPLHADSYHYYLIFQSITDFQLQDWFVRRDILFYFLSFIFKSLNLEYVWLRFLLTSIEMLIFAWIFIDIIKNNSVFLENRKILFLSSIALLLSIDIMFISFMIRYVLMGSLLVLSIYLLYKSKYISASLIYILAFSAHFSCLLFLPCIICALILSSNVYSTYIKIIFCTLILFFGRLIFFSIYNYLPDFLQIDTYMYGTWSNFEYKSFNGMMYYIIQYYVISGITIIFYLFTKHENNVFERITFFILLLFCSTCSYSELAQRIWWILKIFLISSLVLSIIKYKIKKYTTVILLTIILLLIFSQSMVIYGFREGILITDNLKHIISPVTFIFEERNYDFFIY